MSNFEELLKFPIKIEDIHDRYVIGGQSDEFNEILSIKPVFSFQFALFNKNNEYSLNYKPINAKDYCMFLEGLQLASKTTYQEMNQWDRFHFHDVEWDSVTISESDFYDCLIKPYPKNKSKDLTVYQFKVFGNSRVFGFIYRTVFYIVLFDYNHNAYDRDRPKAMKKKKRH